MTHKNEPATPATALRGGEPEPLPKNIPTVNVETSPDIPNADKSPDIKDYKGRYINSVDGEPYALAVVEDAPDGKTHFLINSAHFDNCTKEEFKQRYEKE